ncbi:hypothetical protein F0562_028428 [Nyssa sinensis]|uniref:Plastocyanin-like domain-containing protein n=1 Tax=Nyssa sinensis TaxID=561372 RepID=A0A5J5B069_9ASTE|nr:hypothetical protein F0562_028428 [Nyssa sinensis]
MLLNLAFGAFFLFAVVTAESPYRFFDWRVTYGDIHPLGVRQQGILINGQFPGPNIYTVTNDNLIINVKDQIGSFFYFPSLAFHKAAGGFGGIRILSRPLIPIPFPEPTGDYTVLIGDWYKENHKRLKAILDRGKKLHFPDAILINGHGPNGAHFTVEQGKTYRFRISNVGLQNSLNFRIQGHRMKLVEVEGTHTLQTTFSSLDVHVGQSYSVLVTADQPSQDYYIAVSSRFTTQVLHTTAILHYSNSAKSVSGSPPEGPTNQIGWSLKQARAIRTNLTCKWAKTKPTRLLPLWSDQNQ